MNPTIGRTVIYRTDGRNGLSYDLPAMVTVTLDTHPGDYPATPCHCEGQNPPAQEHLLERHVARRNPLPAPSSLQHVHLTVFTPGGFGTLVAHPKNTHRGEQIDVTPYMEPTDSGDFRGAQAFKPGSGTYVELDVPYAGDDWPFLFVSELFHTWRWPSRTRPS